MTRQERKRLQKRRTKARSIVLLACLLLFLIGVTITYDTMQEAMGIKNHDSILSFGNTGQALKELTEELPEVSGRIQNTFKQWFARVLLLLEDLWHRFANRCYSFLPSL